MIYRNQALKMNLDHLLSSSVRYSKPSSITSLSSIFLYLERILKSYDGNMVDASRICFIVWKNMSEEVSVYSQSLKNLIFPLQTFIYMLGFCKFCKSNEPKLLYRILVRIQIENLLSIVVSQSKLKFCLVRSSRARRWLS